MFHFSFEIQKIWSTYLLLGPYLLLRGGKFKSRARLFRNRWQKNVLLPSGTNPFPKIKLKRLGSGMHPNFGQIGCVFTFFENKKGGKCTQILNFGCFKKMIIKKYIFSNRPTQIFRNPTWGQHNNFLFLA